jgi:L-aspartate oxidase
MTPYDALIVGTGAAGCYAALNLDSRISVLIICKTEPEECDSFLAQGGICCLTSSGDFDAFFEDTMKAGHYQNNAEAVKIMLAASPAVIADLDRLGVDFAKKNRAFLYAREAAHSAPRILYHEDTTGAALTGVLLEAVRKRPNITVRTHTEMTDIIEEGGRCAGIRAVCGGAETALYARCVVLATGGVGGNYAHTTNYSCLTGDAVRIALKRGIPVTNPDHVQIHPTTLYSEQPGRRFLISESVRGEGAVLLDRNGERFADELLPRDALTDRIREKMQEEGSAFVRLSLAGIRTVDVRQRFPAIYRTCLEAGYDITKAPVPVVPAQHYFMGGIATDTAGRTGMKNLYAVGETAYTGVHGANRLASNSLLEAVVFAKRAAEDLNMILSA